MCVEILPNAEHSAKRHVPPGLQASHEAAVMDGGNSKPSRRHAVNDQMGLDICQQGFLQVHACVIIAFMLIWQTYKDYSPQTPRWAMKIP